MAEAKNSYFRVLTVAGSDSGGGAGIQADLHTCAALQCHGMTAITAVTAQNTLGVTCCSGMPPTMVAKQIEAVMTDIGADAIKTGMLFNADIVRATADALSKYSGVPLVVDPVMVSSTGSVLLDTAGIITLRERILPMATVLTPNLPEAKLLLQRDVEPCREDMVAAATALCQMGPRSVLLKGGHSGHDRCDDVLVITAPSFDAPQTVWYEAERVQTRNDHGTGCTLSAAIACQLARGFSPVNAVQHAKSFSLRAIRAASSRRLGNGRGPLHHHFAFWP